MLQFFGALLLLLLSQCVCISGQDVTSLKRKAYNVGKDAPEYLDIWQQILDIDPKNLEAHVMLGWELITSNNPAMKQHGLLLLEECFDETKVQPLIDFSFPQTMVIAATIGRFRCHRKEYTKGRRFIELALDLSKRHVPDGEVCFQMQLASMFDYFPESMEAADAALQNLHRYAQELLSRPNVTLHEETLSAELPGAENDPFVHCLLSLFTLSFYYRADTAAIAAMHYKMAVRGWPNLSYKAPHVIKYEQQLANGGLPCEDRKIKLGVIAGVLSEGHSVSEDFGGVLQRLDRDMFQITYIYLYESGTTEMANFTRAHESDKAVTWKKDPSFRANGAWVVHWGKKVARMKLDMILYLDLTMSTFVRRMGMMRLAPVQMNTHGHPVTSGHDPSIVQYFVSWAEAELPLEESQTHYTEELRLIPNGTLHQYYEPRTLPGGRSRMNGQAFGHLTRKDFGLPEDETNLYLCMQKPFKMHPEFDPLVCGILQSDASGVAVLHQEDSMDNHAVFMKRLARAGCDLERIKFIEVQPHHRLLALYKFATVVLDSYPAGGCTTTREVLELGKPLVTLPTRLLGGRWTRGYYHTIGMDPEIRRLLIADNAEEYVQMAVALGTNATLRAAVEAEIQRVLPNLFHRFEAVEEWQRILLEVSPVRLCPASLGLQEDEL